MCALELEFYSFFFPQSFLCRSVLSMSGKVAAWEKTAGNQGWLLSAATLARESSEPCGKVAVSCSG